MDNKNLLIAEARDLQKQIDSCLWDINKALTKGDKEQAMKEMCRAQLLMCATMQEIDCLVTFIERGEL